MRTTEELNVAGDRLRAATWSMKWLGLPALAGTLLLGAYSGVEYAYSPEVSAVDAGVYLADTALFLAGLVFLIKLMKRLDEHTDKLNQLGREISTGAT